MDGTLERTQQMSFCTSKKSSPLLYNESLYKNGQDLLDIQYIVTILIFQVAITNRSIHYIHYSLYSYNQQLFIILNRAGGINCPFGFHLHISARLHPSNVQSILNPKLIDFIHSQKKHFLPLNLFMMVIIFFCWFTILKSLKRQCFLVYFRQEFFSSILFLIRKNISIALSLCP